MISQKATIYKLNLVGQPLILGFQHCFNSFGFVS